MASNKAALILTGGGARAAYQVGVLQGIRELLPDPTRNPFPIICGTSAGAINATMLACYADNFRGAVDTLANVWRDMHAGDVYRADPLGIAASGAHWLGALAFGWMIRRSPRSLLDNEPLRGLLERHLDFPGIDRAIASGSLYALSLTASGYTSGHSVSFFQGHSDVEVWHRTHRFGCRARLSVDHLLASSAIPFIFPAVRLNREYFGDGSMRQLAPISPAIHLGAEKVLVVGAGRTHDKTPRERSLSYPTLAQIAGHSLASIFLDGLAIDIERMQRINRPLAVIPPEMRESAGVPLRPVHSLIISPSEHLDYIAARHAKALPWSVRALLRGIGAMNRQGGALTSYLLFEQPFTRALIDLGYKDTMDRKGEVEDFLEI